jgi:hypothetical protein
MNRVVVHFSNEVTIEIIRFTFRKRKEGLKGEEEEEEEGTKRRRRRV